MKEKKWQSLLTVGNNSFHQGQFGQAEFSYREAYKLLAFSYRDNPLCSETLIAWICTCHNLATLYETIEKFNLALKFLTVPYEYLLEIVNSDNDTGESKLIAFNGLRLTLSPIFTFAKKYPVCQSCLESYSQTNRLLTQNFLDKSFLTTH